MVVIRTLCNGFAVDYTERVQKLVWARAAFELTKGFLAFLFVILLIHNFIVTIFIVSGPSMDTTLHDRDGVLVNRILYAFTTPQRGDIVVVRYPGDPERSYYVKRVVALPGETLTIADGKVHINGKLLAERYINDQPTLPDMELVIPSNSYFTMGDNREVSSDSRIWGVADRRFILGRVVLTLWPQVAAFPQPQY